MRENSINFSELTSLKKKFSIALENKELEEANEILNEIDKLFLKASGKTFRSNLTEESQERLNNFLENKTKENKSE